MKKLIVLLFLCVNVCGYVFASQAIPGPYLKIQPNGDSIYVYYHPMSARFDRLIGVKSIKNEMQVF